MERIMHVHLTVFQGCLSDVASCNLKGLHTAAVSVFSGESNFSHSDNFSDRYKCRRNPGS